MKVNGLPDRPIRLYEITLLEEEQDSILNIEPVFYEGNNINGAICMLININDNGSIIGFNPDDEEWQILSQVQNKSDKEKYMDESDNVISWINKKYGEDGYGIYGEESA